MGGGGRGTGHIDIDINKPGPLNSNSPICGDALCNLYIDAIGETRSLIFCLLLINWMMRLSFWVVTWFWCESS